MVQHVFQCDICSATYGSHIEAEQCEARGVRPAVDPIGTILSGCRNGNQVFLAAVEEGSGGHVRSLLSYVTRDVVDGRPAEDNRWGLWVDAAVAHRFNPYHAVRDEHRGLPAFKRMVDQLREHDIIPHIWDGSQAIPLTG